MSRALPPSAYRRLLEVGAPLEERPELGLAGLERYELGAVLGRGGMGVVHEAWDKELGRKVALKLLSGAAGLSDSARQRFVREARAAAKLVHPNIATVYDARSEFIAMQHVEGETLAEVSFHGPRELVELLRDAALAIHFAHTEGIVHRDLKPANLMVESGQRPHVYVMDFGLAKERAVDSSLSVSGSVIGTPAYMAPEQAAGRREEVGPAADVYGLGATLYHCLAGRPPFVEEDVYTLLRRVVEDEAPPLGEVAPGVDRDLATIVMKCLAGEPAQRYATALALASDLDRWLRGEPVHARPLSWGYRLRRYVSRRQGAVVASFAAAGVALLLVLPFVIQARARRAAAEEQRDLAERVLELSERVGVALRDAREAKSAGAGHERSAFATLEAAAGECRALLESTEVGRVWFFLARLLAEQGRRREALDAFDRAAELASIAELPLERGLILAALYGMGVPMLGEDPPAELELWRARAIDDLEAKVGIVEATAEPTVEVLYASGLLAWLKGERSEAVGVLKEVLERDVMHRPAHLFLSRLYLLGDETDLAMRHSVIATDLARGYGPAYLAGARASGAGADGAQEPQLLELSGLRELLVDFNALLQLAPGDASFYGFRGQVQVRRALRAAARDDRLDAWQSLERAVGELTSTLAIEPGHAPALVNRGACRAQLDRVLSEAGEPARAGRERAAALADYDAAIAADDTLAVAWFDRAILRERLAQLARLAQRPEEARIELERGRADAREALARLPQDHTHRKRFQALAEELQ